jgi:hypothetical protein
MIKRRYRDRPWRCYELAYLTQLDNPEWQLVHGITRGPQGSTIGHAWLEFDGMVYDAVVDVEMAARDFAEQYEACSTAIYSIEEAAQAAIKSGHYGPWK